MIAITIPIIFFIVTGIVIFYFIRSRHEERMIILEKGADKEQLEYLFKEKTKREHNPLNFIKYGLLLISIGLAICTVTFYQEEITAGFIFILPGISLIIYYFIAKRLQKNE